MYHWDVIDRFSKTVKLPQSGYNSMLRAFKESKEKTEHQTLYKKCMLQFL